MKNTLFFSTAILVALMTSCLAAQSDFFLSTQGLNEGAVNSAASLELGVGETGSFHLYYDNTLEHPNIDTCVWYILSTTKSNVINVTNFETFDYDILVNGSFDVNDRWGDAFGPGVVEMDGQSARASAFTVVGGTGMLDENTSGVFSDAGFDADAGAFHVARIDFETIGPGEVGLVLETDPTVFIGNNGMAIDVSYSSGTVNVVNDNVLIGDVNLDGFVTLLDVNPFIDRLTSGVFQAEADCNEDGIISLLDVAFFIDAIQFP